MNISIKKCCIDDLSDLMQLSKETFYQTFSKSNTAQDMATYLESAYNENKLKKELCNPSSLFFFIYFDEMLAGYLKINEPHAQTDLNDVESLEIERLYVLKDFQGFGLGKRLMEYAINLAIEKGKKYLWLGVWENNQKALRFYKDYKFYKIGAHPFIIGTDHQTDYVMRKDL